jgi:site-specific recombinase XerD
MTKPYKPGDSVQAKFSKGSLVNVRGGTLTHKRMNTTWNALAAVAKEGRWGKLEPDTLTEKQFTKYMEARRETGLSSQCQRVEAGHIRRALRGCGREDFADAVTNKMLGIPQGSRIGKGKATDPQVLAAARASASPGVRAVIDLCNGIGLRIREAVCSAQSLQTWRTELDEGQPLSVEIETKGDRPRCVFLRSEETRQLASDAVDRAIAHLRETGQVFLVESISEEGAMRAIERDFADLGLEADNSAHSLRRDFAVREYLYLREGGLTKREACGKLSIALGHGSSRHRWVWNNYLRATLEAMGIANE